MSTVKAVVENPGKIELTISATFTLNEWRAISESIDKTWRYPMSDLVQAIRDCTHQAEQTFIPEKDDD